MATKQDVKRPFKRHPPKVQSPFDVQTRAQQLLSGVDTFAGYPIDEIPLSAWQELLDKQGYRRFLKEQGITQKQIKAGEVDPKTRMVSLQEAMGMLRPHDFSTSSIQSMAQLGLITAEGTFVGPEGYKAITEGGRGAAAAAGFASAEATALEFLGFNIFGDSPEASAFQLQEQDRYRRALAAAGVRGSAEAGLQESPFVTTRLLEQQAAFNQAGMGMLGAIHPELFPGFQYGLQNQFYGQAFGQYGAAQNKAGIREATQAANKFAENQTILGYGAIAANIFNQTDENYNPYMWSRR